MMAFRNKCKRNEEELHRMLQRNENVNESKEEEVLIEILDDSDHDSDTNEKTKADADDSDVFWETADENEYIFNRGTEHDYRKDAGTVNETDFEVRRYRPPKKVACHICGKLYEHHVLQFHLNKHNGKWRCKFSFRCDHLIYKCRSPKSSNSKVTCRLY